jgi:hypothetical protein
MATVLKSCMGAVACVLHEGARHAGPYLISPDESRTANGYAALLQAESAHLHIGRNRARLNGPQKGKRGLSPFFLFNLSPSAGV